MRPDPARLDQQSERRSALITRAELLKAIDAHRAWTCEDADSLSAADIALWMVLEQARGESLADMDDLSAVSTPDLFKRHQSLIDAAARKNVEWLDTGSSEALEELREAWQRVIEVQGELLRRIPPSVNPL